MKQEELMNLIAETEREIALLPEGSITTKKIKDKEYYYHRITISGKRVEKYLAFEDVPEMKAQIEKRKSLEKQLKALQVLIVPGVEIEKEKAKYEQLDLNTTVRFGKPLKAQIAITQNYKKRKCIKELRDYVFGSQQDKVFIIYGLRRTGKTTMIRQILTELPDSEFHKAAYIQIKSMDTLAALDADLRQLEEKGFKYIFIDEVTLLSDFIEGSSMFSDIYASSGIKIVLSGTDSLGFAFSKEEQLYDRCIMLHTTFIPYQEFEEVLGIQGIDEYIRYGGTMSLGGVNYNQDTPFSNSKTAEEYIDTAIAKNIQHSLKLYQNGGHFRQLLDLYEQGELTNVINRVVENLNHSFTRKVVEKTFESHDISVTRGIMSMLDLLNKEEQSIDMEDSHMAQIKEYLTLLDLILEIDLESLPEVDKRSTSTVLTQPGMRYAQATAIVENLLLDASFQELSIEERKRILDRLLNEIRGRMMEEIVLLETKIARPDKKVFKLQFTIGEFDMVVFDPKTLTCKIYEIKQSKEQIPEQYRHLIDEEKCAMTRHRYGEITGRYVIYCGKNASTNDIQYLNVEDYLKAL